MITFRSLSAGIAATLVLGTVLSACTSIPVDPCSREGVEYRMKESLMAFARKNRGDINDIRKASQFIGGQTPFGAMKVALAYDSINHLVKNFQADVVPDVQEIAEQCGTTQNIRDVFFDFLRDEGVDKRFIDTLDSLAAMLEAQSID